MATKEEFQVKATFDTETKKAVASTSVVDRQGEVIDQNGWDLKNFKKNPLLLWGHDHTIPAIGNAKNIKIEGEGKKAKLTFEPVFHELTDIAKSIKALFDNGILNSFSVGFQPVESEGNTYTKSELLEISAVNVPANPEARMLAYKALKKQGFKKDVIQDVTGIEIIEVKDKKLEARVKELETEIELLAKGPQPQVTGRKAEAEQNISEAKVIARAMDKLLGNANTSRSVQAKVAKRAAEKLIVRNKKLVR